MRCESKAKHREIGRPDASGGFCARPVEGCWEESGCLVSHDHLDFQMKVLVGVGVGAAAEGGEQPPLPGAPSPGLQRGGPAHLLTAAEGGITARSVPALRPLRRSPAPR